MSFKSITSSYKSDMNISFRIIFIKTNIIKVNFIKTYSKNTYFITKQEDIIKNFSNRKLTKRIFGNNFITHFFNLIQKDMYQQLNYTFIEAYSIK